MTKEASQEISPELQATINLNITRLYRDRRRISAGGKTFAPRLTLIESSRGDIVLH